MTSYDLAVFIGAFEPFHNGHLATLMRALESAGRVAVLVGSAERPRSPQNPWPFGEREAMIRAALGENAGRASILPLRDHLYDENAWMTEAQTQIARALGELRIGPDARIALFGHARDARDAYLAAFPQWDFVETARGTELPGRELRRCFLSQDEEALQTLAVNVPEPVFATLHASRATQGFATLLEEHRYLEEYRALWSSAPYPPILVTADAVVVHSGHVLLVQRKAHPGRGLWALPGGFIELDEPVRDAAIRELREETGLGIDDRTLLGRLCGEKVFDAPDRSQRWRTITHALYFLFPTGAPPPVSGGDDAARAQWIPLAQAHAMRSAIFEDHYFILEYFVGCG